VLIGNPRFLYRKLFNGDEAAMEHFLATVCTTEWNGQQDAGRSFAEGTRALLPRHADKIELIEAFGKRFDEMIPGAIEGAVDVLAEVKARGVPAYAITNWSAETFRLQHARFPFLRERRHRHLAERWSATASSASVRTLWRTPESAVSTTTSPATSRRPPRSARHRSRSRSSSGTFAAGIL
jgi:hypothetical protein